MVTITQATVMPTPSSIRMMPTSWPHHGPGPNKHGQEVGIILIELGVGITVACVMVTIFYSYAARRGARRRARQE